MTPDCVENISQEELNEMSDHQVHERMAFLQDTQTEIDKEVKKCQDRLGMHPRRRIPETCEFCGSRNVEARARGGYFCRKCGFRKGLVE